VTVFCIRFSLIFTKVQPEWVTAGDEFDVYRNVSKLIAKTADSVINYLGDKRLMRAGIEFVKQHKQQFVFFKVIFPC
jgi:hypothetical protein